MRRYSFWMGWPVLIGAGLVVVGCNATATPGSALTIGELEARLSAGPERAELEILPGTDTVRELHLRPAEELGEEEYVESEVTAMTLVTPCPCDGALTLELAGMPVTLDADTRYRDAGGDDVTAETFAATANAAIAAGTPLFVRAKRAPTATPADPASTVFLAALVRVEPADAPKIEVNVDADNLVLGAGGGTLTAFGIAWALDVAAGETEIEDWGDDDPEIENEIEIETD